MEFDEKDNEVIRLLTQLKNAEGGYPVEMMALRRQNYTKQLAAMGIGMGVASVLKQTTKSGGGSSLPPVASTLLETALIVAIVAEAGAFAFINREKVSELFRTFSNQPKVEEVTLPPETSFPVVETALTSTIEPTESATPVGTPSPTLLFLTGTSTGNADSMDANSTPAPKDNSGNHYGQTPKPERTKKPGNNKPTKVPKK